MNKLRIIFIFHLQLFPMYRLDHPIPTIRLRQLEKLHRNVFLDHSVDINFVQTQFAVHYESFSTNELHLYGQIFQYTISNEGDNVDFSDIHDQLEYLFSKTNIDIPRHSNDPKPPLIFYTDEQDAVDTHSISNISFPDDLTDADAIFTFACDYFPCLPISNSSNHFLMSLFNQDYHPLIINLYLIYHPLNIHLLKPYTLHLHNNVYPIFQFLSTTNDHLKAIQIIFPILKYVKETSSILSCIHNTLSNCSKYHLSQSLNYPQLFHLILNSAIHNKYYTIISYYIHNCTSMSLVNSIFKSLLTESIYSDEFIIIASQMVHEHNQVLVEYLVNAPSHPISISTILFYNLLIPPLYLPIFQFHRDPSLRNTNDCLISPDQLSEFHLVYKQFLDKKGKSQNSQSQLLQAYHTLLTSKKMPNLSTDLVNLVNASNGVVALKLHHLITLYQAIPLFKYHTNSTNLFLNKHFYTYDVVLNWPEVDFIEIDDFVPSFSGDLILRPFDLELDYTNKLEAIDVTDIHSLAIIAHLSPHFHLLNSHSKSTFLVSISLIIHHINHHPYTSHSILLLSLLSRLTNHQIIQFMRKQDWTHVQGVQLPSHLQHWINNMHISTDIHQFYSSLDVSTPNNSTELSTMFKLLYSLKYGDTPLWHSVTVLYKHPAMTKIISHMPRSLLSQLLTVEYLGWLIENNHRTCTMICSQFKGDGMLINKLLAIKWYKCAYNMLVCLKIGSGDFETNEIKIPKAPKYILLMGIVMGISRHRIEIETVDELLIMMDHEIVINKDTVHKIVRDSNTHDMTRILIKMSGMQLYVGICRELEREIGEIKIYDLRLFGIILRNLCFFKVGWGIIDELGEKNKEMKKLILMVKMGKVTTENYQKSKARIQGIDVVEMISIK